MSAAVTMVSSSQGTPGLEVDVADESARRGAADGRAVQHPGQREVVDVSRLAGDFSPPFLARNGLADHGGMVTRATCTCNGAAVGCL